MESRRRFWGASCLVGCGIALVLSWGASLRAEFNAPVVVSGESHGVTEATIGHDPANNAYVVSVVDSTLRVDVIGPNSRLTFGVPGPAGAQGEPDIALNSRGDIFLCYTEADPDPGDIGREVFLAVVSGGRMGDPLNLSDNRVDDGAPRLALGPSGEARLAWAQTRGDSEDASLVVYYHHGTREKVTVGPGAYPALAVGAGGVAHLVYTRDNDLYYRDNAGGAFGGEIRLVVTPEEPEFDASVGVNSAGDVFVTYESFGSLYLTSRKVGQSGFSPPRVLDAPGVLNPELRISRTGAISIVYAKQGELHYILGASTFLLAPVAVLEEPTGEVESHPSMVIDSWGNLHVAFLRDGQTFYANNVGELQPEFTATPRDGEAPLNVRFQDLTGGRVQVWQWDFGDGTQSSTANPVHRYEQPGRYTVTLRVFSGDREAVLERPDFITVQESRNRLRIPDQKVYPGQRGVWFPVIADHDQGLRGFQVMAVFDPNILQPRNEDPDATVGDECDLGFTLTERMRPEIFECNVIDGRRYEIGCIFDFFEPLDHTTLAAGENHTLVQLVFDVSNRAPQGGVTEIQLLNDSQISRIFNVFVVEGRPVLPVLESARVEIVPISPIPPHLPPLFVRGDTDGNGRIELTDAVQILLYLFRGGADLNCQDAADYPDRGALDISSAIGILQFLFSGRAPPRVPFPNAGIDPTEDTLEPCVRRG